MYSIGEVVAGRYRIASIVGHGGMGTIYRAHDTRLGRTVALKVLRPDLAQDQAACARFLREGQIAAQMSHPNVVRTYDAGEDRAGPFLVQELLSGQTLDQIIPLPPQRAAAILSDIAAALSAIHQRGYIHCDVKPQNILIKDDGTPVLLDFGIARAEGADATMLIATPHYLAPERARGEPPTVASDLYALGIVLFHAVEGRPPFDATTVHAIIQQHIDAPLPSLSLADPMAPALNSVIARAAAKQPQDRYPSADAMQKDMSAIANGAASALPTMVVSPPSAGKVSMNRAAPPVARPPRPPSDYVQQATAAWSAVPAWRKRRWLVYVIGPLLLLSLGYAWARGNRADAVPLPEVTPVTNVAPDANSRVVPPTVGLSFDAAASQLQQIGLLAQRGQERPANEAPGTVVGSEPDAGATLAEGDTVVLHVSAGPEQPTSVVDPTNQDGGADEEADDGDEAGEDEQPRENGKPPKDTKPQPPGKDKGRKP